MAFDLPTQTVTYSYNTLVAISPFKKLDKCWLFIIAISGFKNSPNLDFVWEGGFHLSFDLHFDL